MHRKTIDNFPNMKKKNTSISWYNLYTKPIKSITYKVIKSITYNEYRDNQELEIIFRKYITNISALQYN